ncbi:MAG: MBOAT family protein [Methylomarinum sp.]|nr:MBOAT family protein [Methylomarinum sp.]
MLFNSYTFIIFFTIIIILHYLPFSWRTKKINLLLASYLFYAAWNPPFVILLWISTIADWFFSKRIYTSTTHAKRKLFVIGSLSVNLGMLAFFKYGNFFLENLVQFCNLINIEYHPPAMDIILPVGISFYTFQTLSYTMDIYLKRGKPWKSFLDYALFVTFFPQLVAGPIVRSSDFLPQCIKQNKEALSKIGWGLSLLLLGLFEKVVLADGIFAPVTEIVFDKVGQPSTGTAIAGTLAFAGQIFCDFAGYSTCAIGAAMCLGFNLPDNFRFPYAAIGFSDFWKRWHISLSSWLRDYLYIPLGGNKKGKRRTQINLILTMLLGGLWHGASWTFVIWGGLHGFYLIIEKLCIQLFGKASIWKKPIIQLLLASITFSCICLAWIFFRAGSFDQAVIIILSILGSPVSTVDLYISHEQFNTVIIVMSLLLTTHWLMRNKSLELLAKQTPWPVRSCVLALMFTIILMMPGEDRAFIYFQF